MVNIMDPVITHILTIAFGLLFLSAGIQKLRNLGPFREVLIGYRLIPLRLVRSAGIAVPLLEIFLGFGMLISPLAMVAGAVLLLTYAGAIGINLKRGNVSLDCGCQLGQAEQTISTALVHRNIILAVVSLVATLPEIHRPLSAYDFGAIAFGLVMCGLVYTSCNMLIANDTRFKEINS